MVQRKSKAVVSAADGAGGLTQVVDHRFLKDDWPIRFSVPTPGADTWLQYLSAECRKKGWTYNSLGQIGPEENSASLTIMKGPDQPQLAIVWERKPGRPLSVKARSVGVLEFLLQEATAFLDDVTHRCLTQVKESFHLCGQLAYEGLAWLGELWLDDSTRLSKPSRDGGPRATDLPRIVVVDCEVEAIDHLDGQAAASLKLRELAVFLTVTLGHELRVPRGGRAWTWSLDESDSKVRELGYIERSPSLAMPIRGADDPILLRSVTRPDLSILSRAWDLEYLGEKPPSDIVDLWRAFSSLSPERRRQFLAVGALWRLAISLENDNATVAYALITAACEALKPQDRKFRNCNFYDVTAALLGSSVVDQVKLFRFQPVAVRNARLHGGDLLGSEFVRELMMSSFSDPSFRMSYLDLQRRTQALIIEWLRRDGEVVMADPAARPRRASRVRSS
jgi:hypothetical protein